MQRADKQVVKRDIDQAGNEDKDHRAFGIAHAAEDGAEDIIRRNARNARKTNRQIADRPLDRRLRRRHDGRDRAAEQQQPGRQHERERQKQRHRIARGRGGLRPVVRADGPRDRDRRAHRQPHDHDRQHVHDLRADGDGRRPRDALILANDEQVRHPIERLQQVRQQIRQRKPDQLPAHAAGRQILFHPDPSLLPRMINPATVAESSPARKKSKSRRNSISGFTFRAVSFIMSAFACRHAEKRRGGGRLAPQNQISRADVRHVPCGRVRHALGRLSGRLYLYLPRAGLSNAQTGNIVLLSAALLWAAAGELRADVRARRARELRFLSKKSRNVHKTFLDFSYFLLII